MAQSLWRANLSESIVKKVTETLLETEKIPIVNSAKLMLTESGVRLNSVWSQRSFTQKAKKSFSRDYFLTSDLQKVVARSNPVPIESNERIVAFSKNESFKFYQISKANESQFLEIWSDSGLEKVYNLGEIDLHGTVNFDSEFGSITVNKSETILAYIAEKKKKKAESFFTQKKDEKNIGSEYSYNESWGEQMTDYSQSVIVLLNLKNDQFDVIDEKVLPAGLCPGQIVWASESTLVGIGISTTPRRLGIVYCSNRPSNLFRLDVFNNKYEEIVNSSVTSCKNPRVTPDGQKLLWLERGLKKPFPGPHQSSFSLKSLELNEGDAKIKTVVPEVYEFNIGTDTFAGFYIGSPPIPENCFSSDGLMVVSVPVVDSIFPAIINLNSGEVSVQLDLANVQIVDVCGNMVVGLKSTAVEAPSIMVGSLENQKSLVLRPLEESSIFPNPGTVFKTFNHVPTFGHPDPIYADVKFNSIYIGPVEGELGKIPLIVWPHGGPHSVTLATFYRELTFFNSLGYGVLLVNYRGSTGAGDKGIWSLLGHIGDTDVKDVFQASQECLKKVPQLNPDKVVLFGGSHGGFLVVHLAGQYPKAFKAVTARNPVINLATMIGLTDIPDWTMNETLNDYTFLVPGDTAEMYKMSPTSHAANIEAPVLLQIGSEDLRVPPTQGYELFHKLKVLGKKVDMDVYPDNHPLGKIAVAGNVMVSTALFFHACLEDPVA